MDVYIRYIPSKRCFSNDANEWKDGCIYLLIGWLGQAPIVQNSIERQRKKERCSDSSSRNSRRIRMSKSISLFSFV